MIYLKTSYLIVQLVTMTQNLCEQLSLLNKHQRDENIQFFEDGHKYIIISDAESKYTSVTTLIHSYFQDFDSDKIIQNMMNGKSWKEGNKYWGLTPQQIKQLWEIKRNSAASSGTELHFKIECFMNNSILEQSNYTNKELYELYMADTHENESIEWQYFIHFIKDTPHLKPYRTEWTVFNEHLKIAGSIDMVYENPDGTLSIYDWKRTKEITRINKYNKFANNEIICHFPDSNFWHYAIQLNIYKAILEDKYGKIVKDLYLVKLHPDAEEKTYELIKVPDLKKEISYLFLERKNNLLMKSA